MPPSTQKSLTLTDRYRSMTRAAPTLFTAESVDELEKRLASLATEVFPKANFFLLTFGLDHSAESEINARGPSETVRALATEAMPSTQKPLDDQAILWIDPSTAPQLTSIASDPSEFPEAIALIPLSPKADRAALLVYPDESPVDRQSEAVETFAELARDATDACSTNEEPDLLQTEEADSLVEVANTIASQLELSEAIRVVARQTSQLLEADRSSVWLYDEETDEIYTIVAQELGNEEIRMPADQGLAGHVLHTGEPLNLEDAYEHPAFDPTQDRETGYRTRSMLCIPLYDRQGEKLGVFQVINKLEGPHFTAEDEELLEALAGSASVAIANALLYEEQQKQFESFIQVLATTIDSRDPTTGQHTVMVTGLAVLIAEEMELSSDVVEKIRVAGILHDVGKIVLPDEVLLKQGELTDKEYELVQSHVSHTTRILDRIRFHRTLIDVPEIAGAHHERLDGEGYPQGLSAEDLTLPMRILAVADVFHALIQDRPYKDSFSIEEALNECRRISGSTPMPSEEESAHLDPRVVEALAQNIEREGTEQFRERLAERSGFEEQNVFAPDLNLPG